MLGVGFVCLVGGPILAQAPLPPTDEIKEKQRERTETVRQLSREAKELGREYLEVVAELQEVLADYSRSLQREDGQALAEQQAKLQAVVAALARGSYLNNFEKLSADLEQVEQALDRRSSEVDSRQLTNLARNFRRDLRAIKITLESEIIDEYRNQAVAREEMEECLAQAAQNGRINAEKLSQLYVKLIGESGKLNVHMPQVELAFDFAFDTLFDSVWVMHDGDGTGKGGVWVSSAPKPPSPPSVPSLPRVVVGDRNIVVTERSGDTKVVREFGDSLRVEGSSETIEITNPNGQFRLIGWDRELVTARAEVAVQSKDAEKASAVAEQIRLEIEREGGVIKVNYVMPRLNDPRIAVSSRQLEVFVPRGNPILATSSFGGIELTDLQNDIVLRSKHSTVLANEIEGRVEIRAYMGNVAVDDVSGTLMVSNHHSPVQITSCEGAITVTNEFDLVSVGYSRGPTKIQNSGEVRVVYHDGEVTVRNRNGQVWVQHSQGGFDIENEFQPVHLEYLEGDIVVTNRYAPIFASDIAGGLRAKNMVAPIKASYFSGPIHFDNDNGPVVVEVTDDLLGSSDISTNSGTVTVTLEPTVNLFLRASTTGGEIQSTFPMTMTSSGGTRTGELSLGNGRNKLTVTGKGTKIFVNEED